MQRGGQPGVGISGFKDGSCKVVSHGLVVIPELPTGALIQEHTLNDDKDPIVRAID